MDRKENQSILLINPGFRFKQISSKYEGHYIFPFGLGYIASYLLQKGHRVDIWDIYIEQNNYDDVKRKINSGFLSKYSHIGITGIISQFIYIERLTNDIKAVSNAIITIGGPIATYSYELLLKNTPIDFCVIGYGEHTYLELIENDNYESINGITYKKGGQIKKTDSQNQINELDSFPMPAFELFDMDFYIRHTGMMDVVRPWYKKKRVFSMITARGCPYNCNFCSKSIRKTAYKNIDKIIEEIKYYRSKFNIQAIHFVDELLVISKKRVLELCQKLKPLDLKWDAQGRVNLVDREMLTAMKEAGCVCIGFGIESGSQKILDVMNKKITTAQIKTALDICRKIKLAVKVQLIYGYPGENNDSLNETIKLFREIKYPARRLSFITPLPGSSLYETAKRDGFIGNKESDSMTELKFIRELCNKGGMCRNDFFYNRTEFSDNEFVSKHKYIEKSLLNNFIRLIFKHPRILIKYWSVYKYYLNNWRYHSKFLTYLTVAPVYILTKPKYAIYLIKKNLFKK